MIYNITLNNGIATVTQGIQYENALHSLEQLKGASIIRVSNEIAPDVANVLKVRALSEISAAQNFWESILYFFSGCFGYQTTAQKVAFAAEVISQKKFEPLVDRDSIQNKHLEEVKYLALNDPAKALEKSRECPEYAEKSVRLILASTQDIRIAREAVELVPDEIKLNLKLEYGLFVKNELDEILKIRPEFLKIYTALNEKRYDSARLQVHAARHINKPLSDLMRKALLQHIAILEIEESLNQGLFFEPLLKDVYEPSVKKDFLNRAEWLWAKGESPVVYLFVNAEKTDPNPLGGAPFFDLLEEGNLEEALACVKGRDPDSVLQKLANFYLEKNEPDKARRVIPFIANLSLRFEFVEKVALLYLKNNRLNECLDSARLLPEEAEKRTLEEASKTSYSVTRDQGLVSRILQDISDKDPIYLVLISQALSYGCFNDANSWISLIKSDSIKEQAFKKIEYRQGVLEKQAELESFASSFISSFLPPLDSIDSPKILKKVIDELSEKIREINCTEKERACFDYLASLDHYDLAFAFARQSSHFLALQSRYGLYKESKFEEKIKQWVPEFNALLKQKSFEELNDALKKAFNHRRVNNNRMRSGLYQYAVIYVKGKMIEEMIQTDRLDEALNMAKTVRFLDFRLGVRLAVEQKTKEKA